MGIYSEPGSPEQSLSAQMSLSVQFSNSPVVFICYHNTIPQTGKCTQHLLSYSSGGHKSMTRVSPGLVYSEVKYGAMFIITLAIMEKFPRVYRAPKALVSSLYSMTK